MTDAIKDRRSADRVEIVLPSPNTKRWVVAKKAQVVRAIELGVLPEAEAYRRYRLTPEELAGWRRALNDHGVRGLRVTRLGHYRAAKQKQVKA